MRMGTLGDTQFVGIVLSELETGQHRNPTDRIEYFTDAYFHRPDELAAELEEAGFQLQHLISAHIMAVGQKPEER